MYLCHIAGCGRARLWGNEMSEDEATNLANATACLRRHSTAHSAQTHQPIRRMEATNAFENRMPRQVTTYNLRRRHKQWLVKPRCARTLSRAGASWLADLFSHTASGALRRKPLTRAASARTRPRLYTILAHAPCDQTWIMARCRDYMHNELHPSTTVEVVLHGYARRPPHADTMSSRPCSLDTLCPAVPR